MNEQQFKAAKKARSVIDAAHNALEELKLRSEVRVGGTNGCYLNLSDVETDAFADILMHRIDEAEALFNSL